MSSILRNSIRYFGRYEQYKLEQSCKDPWDAQLRLLRRLLNTSAQTHFGQEHDFKNVRNIHDYRRQVPIRDYDGHRPYIEKIIAGSRRALTCDPPFMFNTTSGTTGTPKYIPWNASIDRLGRALTRLWIYRCLQDHPGVLDYKVLCMVSAAVEGAIGGLPFGSASGHIYRSTPALVRQHYALPYETAEINDYDVRYFVSLRLGIEQRVSVISTANPSTLIRLAEIGITHTEHLIRSIHDGTLGAPLPDPEMRGLIEGGLRPNPQRARELENCLRRHGSLRPVDYWPDLKLVGCWTGSSIGSRLASIIPYYGNVPVRDLGFLASEARMSVPVADHAPEGILALNTNFYEFIPETEIDAKHPQTLHCGQLERGQRYHIILTTAGGLYRYDINDVIEVSDYHGKCPMIAFIRKGRDITNIIGEKLHVNHCLSAIRSVEKHSDLTFAQFRFAADSHNNRYQVFVEPKRSNEPLDASIVASIDQALCEQNIEYAQKRRSHRLAAPTLHVMRPGWSENEVRCSAKEGRRDAEFKWQHLLEEPRRYDTEWIRSTISFTKTVESGYVAPAGQIAAVG